MELVQVSVFAVVTYFMFGFQATATKFFVYWATLVVFALCSETLGYMAAIVTPDSKVGVAVLSIVLLLLISFSGYLVRISATTTTSTSHAFVHHT
jgi:ABC-type multidrug transport system permease subunit